MKTATTPRDILEQARRDGVEVLPGSAPGTVKLRGDAQAVKRWAAILTPHKPELVALLAEAANDPAPTTAQPSASGRTCRQCAHLTKASTCSRPVEAGLSERFGIRWPSPDHAERCAAFEARDRQAPAAPTGWDRFWPPASEEECRAMAATIERGLAMGLTNDEAELAADAAHLAAREGDNRRPCLVCAHLRAGASSRWWCAAERQPLADVFVVRPHRCPQRLPVERVGGQQ
ncbi:hypothetical protein LCC91_05360 [Tepidimonas taiwanensis]|uniref:TubC N-terminal docking domain-containing protein n=1 Tax=Tepidimonas taiwanensis TaxID=307486 RepID=A0A554X0K4_9BURK|nr:hypothetical protein [Tepidimonas taiwanensis]TSE29338.1 hypothetical protein Ttaiw_02326 [Tepidimonas taiwanensis]UBQ06506.1 hypothetical protein LCC91_05360 [Tepidimonas taiwanensis]